MSFKMKLFLVGCLLVVGGVSTAVLAADDDLEGLLQELGGTKKPDVPAEKPAEVTPAAPVEPVAPVAEPAPVAPVEKPAEVPPVPEPAPVPPVEKPAEVPPVEPVAPMPEPAPAVEPTPAEVTPEVPAVAAEPKPAETADEQSQIVSELITLETTRLKSMDDHGLKLLENAEKSFKKGDYMLACEQYKQAQLFIVNRPANAAARKRAADGEAEAYYLEAAALFKIRELGRAKAMAEEAHRRGHPKAARLLELIKQEPEKAIRDTSSISHRLNEADYKTQRDEVRRRLRRSRQYFTTAEYAKAIEECELVLRDYPDNTDAIELRKHIGEHMQTVAELEFKATREIMIKDVTKAWTPERYAVESPQLPKGSMEVLTKTPTVSISETKSAEQIVNRKLKNIVIPEVTFRPPATIVDAIDFFKQASRDYDDPEIPLDQRGVNLILKLASTAAAAPAAGAAADPFAASATATTGIPVIPAMSARFINLFDALKLVCDVTGMKFRISGNIVMIVPLNDPDEKLLTRSYNVLPTLQDRLTSASSELSSRGGGGGARGDATFMSTESMGQVRDEEKWKQFFQEMGVQWPIGSGISYLSTIGKLRVTNTSEWLATFEQVLEDLNVTPRLVEIETRFVEVSQSDLNSLGFEWLLNGDFSFSAGGFAKKALGLKNFSNTQIPILDALGNALFNPDGTPMMGYAPYTQPGRLPTPPYAAGQYGQIPVNNHNMNVSGFGDGAYSTGMRYLNSANNPIVGEGIAVNDQFLKLNAFIGGADISMILHMLCQRSDTDVLSAPKVTTKSGQEAIMKVVTEYIYPSEFNVQISQQGNQGGGSLNGGGTGEPVAIVEPQNFTMREVGVILQVVPEVSSEGQMINLTMKPQVVSEPVWKNYGTKLPKTVYDNVAGVAGAVGVGAVPIPKTEYVELPMEQPFFTVRSVETQLLVYNGATVVMGGLITEARKTMEDKIPLLGDIPYLGRFFRSSSEKSDKRNLLIFVTARLVDPAGRFVRTSGNDTTLASPGGTPQTPLPAAAPAMAPAAMP